jgi:rubrerythrin
MSFLSKLLNRDEMSDLQEVLVNLGFLTDAEEKISEFYRLCAVAMPQEADFWQALAKQESKHAENVREMISRITREPKLFRPDNSFSTVEIRLFAVEMQTLTQQLNEGRVSHADLHSIALEIENSTVEVCYGRMVKTEDGIFNMLARQNDDESALHKSSILSKINPPLLQPQSGSS